MEEVETTEPIMADDYWHNNSTESRNGTTLSYSFSPDYNYYVGSAAVINFIVGAFGNILTLAAIFHDNKLRKSKASWFIASLSASDLVACLTVLIQDVIKIFGSAQILHSKSVCQITFYFTYCVTFVSIMSLLLITLNRFVAIVQNSWYHKLYRTKSVILQILLVWIIIYGGRIPLLFSVDYGVDVDERGLVCHASHTIPENGFSVDVMLMLLTGHPVHGFIYILVMVGSYIWIFWHVRQSRKLVESYKDSSTTAARHSASKTEIQLAKTMGITLLVLLLSGVPFFGALVIWPNARDIPYGFGAFAYVCWYSSYATNFLVYAVWNPQYRAAYLNLLQINRCRKK